MTLLEEGKQKGRKNKKENQPSFEAKNQFCKRKKHFLNLESSNSQVFVGSLLKSPGLILLDGIQFFGAALHVILLCSEVAHSLRNIHPGSYLIKNIKIPGDNVNFKI